MSAAFCKACPCNTKKKKLELTYARLMCMQAVVVSGGSFILSNCLISICNRRRFKRFRPLEPKYRFFCPLALMFYRFYAASESEFFCVCFSPSQLAVRDSVIMSANPGCMQRMQYGCVFSLHEPCLRCHCLILYKVILPDHFCTRSENETIQFMVC